jgi:hypothetical protein
MRRSRDSDESVDDRNLKKSRSDKEEMRRLIIYNFFNMGITWSKEQIRHFEMWLDLTMNSL